MKSVFMGDNESIVCWLIERVIYCTGAVREEALMEVSASQCLAYLILGKASINLNLLHQCFIPDWNVHGGRV